MDDAYLPPKPLFETPIAHEIWDKKYRFKDPSGTPIDQDVTDTWRRIARDLAKVEKDPDCWEKAFYWALEDFKFLPAGRIIAGTGTGRDVTLFNCFVMGTVPDSIEGIFEHLKEAAKTMQQGGGIGYDFSTIRPKGTLVKGVGADASGPLSFMDCWDSMCRTIMSAGSRRGAMMATMRCDHPDIEDFIQAKQDPGRLRMFNLSVLVTDKFMNAVKNNKRWPLRHAASSQKVDYGGPDNENCYTHKFVGARELWNKIMQLTYDYAEPGVIFIDRINKTNNLNYVETISATNPCGEQPLPPYGACLLGSINLTRFAGDSFYCGEFFEDRVLSCIDWKELSRVVKIAVRMLDNVIDVSKFPMEKQQKEAKAKRRIGLGVTGLADMLAMCNFTYGSSDAIKFCEKIMAYITETAYEESVNLAKEKGAFPAFKSYPFIAAGTFASKLPDRIKNSILQHGIRNSHLTSIAPTGTISLFAGNISSGIEPIFATEYERKILQKDGSKTTQTVKDYAFTLWEKRYQVRTREMYTKLPKTFITAQDLPPEAHIKTQAAVQEWVDSSISKTINLPETISFEDFQDVYFEAYANGCKGCTTYRPNAVTGSVISVKKEQKAVCPECGSENYKSEGGCSTCADCGFSVCGI